MSDFDIIPLGRNLLVRLNEVAEKKAGKVWVPDEHSELSRVATVLAKGESCERPIQVGDKVLVDFHAGTIVDMFYRGEITSINDTYRIMDELAAQAIIRDK